MTIKKHITVAKQSIVVAKINKEQQNSSYALYVVICLRTYCYSIFVFLKYIKGGSFFPNMVKKSGVIGSAGMVIFEDAALQGAKMGVPPKKNFKIFGQIFF